MCIEANKRTHTLDYLQGKCKDRKRCDDIDLLIENRHGKQCRPCAIVDCNGKQDDFYVVIFAIAHISSSHFGVAIK